MRMARTCVPLNVAMCLFCSSLQAAPPVRFGAESLLPDDARAHFARSVNFAPADGQVCDLNPPRFRWCYHPSQPGQGGDYLFTFQVASDAGFEHRLVDVQTDFNFYNTIAPLPGSGPFYWRIGYKDRTAKDVPFEWSQVRRFTIAKDADVWDRSGLARPDFASKPHPRILLTAERLPRLHRLIHTDPGTRAIFERIQRQADAAVESDWWAGFPTSDREKFEPGYLAIAQDLVAVAFCWRVTADPRYAGVLQRAVTMARYPRGGRFSPQDAGGDSAEDSTQSTEFVALLYDWLYPDLAPAERKDFADCLDWRIEHFVNHFSWKYVVQPRERRSAASGPASRAAATQAAASRPTATRPVSTQPMVYYGSLSTTAGSHQYEGFWDTFPASLAAYEDSPNARVCFALGLNYMIGVGSSHGFEEGWNEGPGYGNSKFAWLVNSTSYLDSVFPEFGIGRNPWLRRQGEYFRSVTPVGLQHGPWGHGSNKPEYFETGHRKSYRKLAYLTGDGRFLANYAWYAAEDAGDAADMMRPWIECTLPLWRNRPEPQVQEDAVRLFPVAGWVTALSGAPSDPGTYKHGVGMIFACRPVGAYSHAFACDNSFHVFAYGQDISHAAGSSDYEPHAFHTMSHNAILVDGLGQAQPRQAIPEFSRIIAFAQRGDTTYWCGDATMAYPHSPARPGSWWGRVGEVYSQRDLSYLTRVNRHVLFVHKRYFVILDDLAAAQPAQWTWLYHVLSADSFDFDKDSGSVRYVIGGVPVSVTQLLGSGQLDVQDQQGDDGFRNPLTGEDYKDQHGAGAPVRRFVAAHNLWLTTRDKHPTWRFLSVIYPVAPGAAAPQIERLDDLTIRVSADGRTDVVSFDPRTKQPATITVDLAAVAPVGLHTATADGTTGR